MKPSFIFFLILSIFVKSQNTRDTESLFSESRDLLYKKPKESAVISQFLLKNSTADNDKVRALILLTKSDLLRGDYSSATEKLFQSLELSKKEKNSNNNIQINYLLRRLCDDLGIEYSQLYLIQDKKDMDQKYYGRPVKPDSQSNRSNNPNYAVAYADLGKNDSAMHFASKIRNYEPYYFYTLAKIRFTEKNFRKSIEELEHLKPFESKVQDIWLKEKIYKLNTENYKELKNWDQYKVSYQLQNALQDSVSLVKETARISFLSKIDQKQDEILASKSDELKKIIYLLIISIFGVITLAYFLNRRLNLKKNNREKAIREAQERQRFITENKLPENAGKIVIPDKTVQFLLEKLELFEKSEEYIDPSVSLNQLAENLSTNTKYLSEIINTHKNKNFHTYINELRINYIINKLRSNPVYLKYKVSHLAEEAGFSSHSLFSTVFKQVTGHSPASYIKSIIKKE